MNSNRANGGLSNAAPRPLGFVATGAVAAAQTLTRLRHHRIWWFAGGGALLLAAAAWLLMRRAHDRTDATDLFCILAWWVQGTVLMPWLTLWLGVQVVHGSLEDRSCQYLFLRPVGRVPLLVGRFVAVAVVAVILAALGTVALAAGTAGGAPGPDPAIWTACGVFVRTLALGAVAYAAAAMLFATWCNRPLVWAAFFVVGLQQLTANLPVSAGLRQLTITDPMRRLVFDGLEPNPRLAEALWPAEPSFSPDQIGAPIADLVWFTAVCLGIAVIAWRTIEYDARPRD
jgi:hypothetical protein